MVQLLLRALDRGDVRKHRHIVRDVTSGITHRTDVLRRRMDLRGPASIPDLALPLAGGQKTLPYLPVVRGVVATRVLKAGALADHVLDLETGDRRERVVDGHDSAVRIGNNDVVFSNTAAASDNCI